MNEARKKQILLGLVLALLAFFAYRQFSGVGAEIGSLAGPYGERSGSLLAALPVIPSIPWDRLEASPAGYNPKGRNLFKYGRIKPPPPSAAERAAMRKARLAEEAARKKAEEDRLRQQRLAAERQKESLKRATAPQYVAPPRGPAAPAPPPPPPIVTFKFIGYMGPAENKIAVLVDGEDFYLGRIGEVVNEEFRIVEIGFEWVQVGYTNPLFADQTRRILMGE